MDKDDNNWDRIAFLFEGGGALGAFQVGVYEALWKAGYLVNWVSGISIGAINAAIVAGNKTEQRLPKLKEFWQRVITPSYLNWWPLLFNPMHLSELNDVWQAQTSLFWGQPGFFSPKPINPLFLYQETPDNVSFYDTSLLKETLRELIDFDILNNGEVRLTLSAVQLSTGQQVQFDSAKQYIGIEHIMASGALPPGFPAVKIDKEYYWDGALVNNSSLEIILNDLPNINTLCFMMQLFDPDGALPNSLDKVLLKQKEIIYTSNYQHTLNNFCENQDLRHTLKEIYNLLPAYQKKKPQYKHIPLMGNTTKMTLVKFHRHAQKSDRSSKDYNFTKAAVKANINMGYKQASRALKESVWKQSVTNNVSVVLYDVFAHKTEQRIVMHGKETHKSL
ncbi:patatin-like phospholipase family protein [Legionella sp. D16C41]|uniref:patatin-like phospholipase family protein n=1 Tax=Legionella sp. D16C41 TaxID=3402688 RepID=UPI003AF736B4